MLTGKLHRRSRLAPPPSGAPAAEAGSGTAIGVTILFPMLMLVIVSIHMMAETARIEQAIQSAANRAARTASLCCSNTSDAESAAQNSLTAAVNANAINRILCNNDLATDSNIIFVDVAGNDAASGDPVPPGGTVYVFVKCRVPPLILGGFGFPGVDLERNAMGVAIIDPFRQRHGT